MAQRTSPANPAGHPEDADHSEYALFWPVVLALLYAGIAALILLLL